MNDLILYTTEDGRSQIKLRAKDQTVWLAQREMAQLFDVSTDNVGLHLKNIFEDGELSREATTEESSVVQIEGGREVQRPVTLYNLDAILPGPNMIVWVRARSCWNGEKTNDHEKHPRSQRSRSACLRRRHEPRRRGGTEDRHPDRHESDRRKRWQAHPHPRAGVAGGCPTRRPPTAMTDTNQKKLGSTLWGIADQLRGAMDADDFRDYMLSFLFLRYPPSSHWTARNRKPGRRSAWRACSISPAAPAPCC